MHYHSVLPCPLRNEVSLIFRPNSLFLLSNISETGKVLLMYVPDLAQPKYFASLRICIFYIKDANAMIGQGWERSPTAQNANIAK